MVTINRKLALVILVVLLVGMGLVLVNMMREGGDGSSVRGVVSGDGSESISVVERAKARRAREAARRNAIKMQLEREAGGSEAEEPAPRKAQSTPSQPKAEAVQTKRQTVTRAPAPVPQPPVLQPPDSDPPQSPSPGGTGNSLQQVEVIGIDNGAVLRIVTAIPVERYKYFSLPSPNRLVIDLYGSWSGTAAPTPAPNPWIAKIRTGVHPGKLRLVADISMEAPGPVSARQNSPTEIVVTLRK